MGGCSGAVSLSASSPASHSLSLPICARISRIRRLAFWIFRFNSPFSVAIPFFSIWQAATPMWTVGISSMPRSALLRWSIRSALPFCSKKSFAISAHALRHRSAFSCLFQSIRSIFRVLYLPLGSRIFSPLSSRTYSFFDFAAHAPFSSRGRIVKRIWA